MEYFENDVLSVFIVVLSFVIMRLSFRVNKLEKKLK